MCSLIGKWLSALTRGAAGVPLVSAAISCSIDGPSQPSAREPALLRPRGQADNSPSFRAFLSQAHLNATTPGLSRTPEASQRMLEDLQPEVVYVERIAPGGDGLGRLSKGELVFIKAAAPGDQVEVASLVRRKGVAHAEVGRLIQSGPERIEPICPLASSCGGCNLMHLSLEGDKQAKLAIVSDAFRRS